jgi:hypothetical protein
MESDGRYYAIRFDEISVAVNYCGALVPHVVSRLRGGGRDGGDSPAIWFHVAPRTNGGPAGCELLMTRGAILAALESGLPIPAVSPATRATLPAGAVLVLGEDTRQAPSLAREPLPADPEALLDIIQLSA